MPRQGTTVDNWGEVQEPIWHGMNGRDELAHGYRQEIINSTLRDVKLFEKSSRRLISFVSRTHSNCGVALYNSLVEQALAGALPSGADFSAPSRFAEDGHIGGVTA